MIKIFYKKDFEKAVETINSLYSQIEDLKRDHQKEIDNLKYENILNQSQDYNPENDPEVFKAEIERLKANHEIEMETWKIQVEDLKRELKVVKSDRDTYKKENKQLVKEKASALVEKSEKKRTTKKKTTKKKKEEKEVK